MGTGDSPEMQKMQEEAIRRAREFSERPISYRNSQKALENPTKKASSPIKTGGGSLLNELLQDKEKTLILLLLAMICEESDSPEALFALLYLLY